MYETLIISEPVPKVRCVMLNRPAVSNALSTQTGLDLIDFFETVGEPGDSCRAVILTGSGDRAFCGGADLKERRGMSTPDWQAQHAIFEHMLRAIINCPIPTVAAVNGAAYAGGCELVLATDFAYAVPEARFALTEVSLGIMPGGGGTQTLPRAIGSRRASEMIFRAKPCSAEQARDWGIVNGLVPAGELMKTVLGIAAEIAANAPLSIRQAKSAIANGMQMDLQSALRFEIEAYNRLVDTADRQEGINAFNEKRRAVFVGR